MINFSNRVEQLYIHLKKTLYRSTSPFANRFIIVPSPAMKSWLILKMAQDPELGIAAGIEVGHADPLLHKIFNLLSASPELMHAPSTFELALAIEIKIRQLLLNEEREEIWQPLLSYLNDSISAGEKKWPQRVEKRISHLAEKLAHLFKEYGKYGGRMLTDWQTGTFLNWQQQLWTYLEAQFAPWGYPYHRFESFAFNPEYSRETEIHLFAMSYLLPVHHRFLLKVGAHVPVHYYLLSPCQEFWSDILSEKESKRLKRYWKKRGATSSQQMALEEFLRDTNPLLANFGRLGREMAQQVEESGVETVENYLLPSSIYSQETYQDLLSNRLSFQHSPRPLTMLESLQADMLLLRNPHASSKVIFNEYDESIQIHQTSRPMQEVQVLYNALLKAIEKHSTTSDPICPQDIIVMAPNIMDYEPYIKCVFGSSESLLDFQLMDLQMPAQSRLVQSFLHLLSIPSGRWDAATIIELLNSRYLQLRHQLSSEDVQHLKNWVKEAGITWGKNRLHRNELLKRNYCTHEMIESGEVGTWEYGIGRMLAALASLPDPENQEHLKMSFPPLEGMDTSQSELLGKFIRLMQSLFADLQALNAGIELSLKEWSSYLKCLLEAYFAVPTDDEKECYKTLIYQIESLNHASKTADGHRFSFTWIQRQLELLVTKETINYRETHLQAVKFCSLKPMRSIPAKIVALIGLQEGSFPRKDDRLSLNLLLGNPQADYCPSHVDLDRYLYLEALLSARLYFIITFTEDQERMPSLLITELIGYLDQSCMIQEQKPSQLCVRKHPFLSFDPSYFAENALFPSYSTFDFKIASAYCGQEKKAPHQFVSHFYMAKPPSSSMAKERCLNLHDLISFAKDPIKAYFNKTLGIYLEKEGSRIIKTEEQFVSSALDQAILSRKALSTPLELVLDHASKVGSLPKGPYKELNISKIKSEAEKLKLNFTTLKVDYARLVDIELTAHCQVPFQSSEKKWQVPPLNFRLEDGTSFKIIGKLADVSPQGLVGYIEEEPEDVIKTWPLLLVFCNLLNKQDISADNQIIFAKSAKAKNLDLKDPERLLKHYLEYYRIGMQCISPLLPDWVPHLLTQNAEGFKHQVSMQMDAKRERYGDEYVKWLAQGAIPHSQSIIENWQYLAHQLFGDLYFDWFPKK